MADIIKKDVPIQAPSFEFPNKSAVTVTKREGNTTPRVAVATYDVAVDGGAIGAHGLGVYIPAKAVITRVLVDVVTTFADGVADAATIALHAQAAGDIVAAITIADGTNVWDAGVHGSKIGFPNYGADAAHDSAVEVAALHAATMLKTTAVREIIATVAEVALTAGKMNIYVDYFISD